MRKLLFILLSLCGLGFWCRAANDTTKTNLKVLYVGNSLTYTNDLPALVEEIAKQDGKFITSRSICLPDYSLEDHWNDGNVEAEIGKGNYDLVIMQQGPSALPESQVLLLEYAKRFAKICAEHQSTMALYMVWPSGARLFDLDNVIYSYTNAAKKTGSLLLPAGLAWKWAWKTDPALPLYGPDDFHPSMDGSVLAALTIYCSLSGKNDFNFLQYDQCSWKNEINRARFDLLTIMALKTLQ